jgi:hypothetical protein
MRHLPYTLIVLAAATGFATAQATSYTTPVGYITCEIAGTSEAPGSTQVETYITPTLVQPNEFSAQTTGATGAVVDFASGVPTTLDNTYVLEITAGANEGWWSTVLSSTSTSITLNDTFPGAVGVQVSVRKHNTLGSFLGENKPGLVDFNGVDPSDEVQIWDPVAQSVTAYGYVTGANLGDPQYPNGAWLKLSNSAIANNDIIEPGTAIRVVRIGSTSLSFVVEGDVKVTKTQLDLYPNFNWVGTPAAAGATLNGMNLNTSLVEFDGVSPDYDELNFLAADQSSVAYAAYDTGSGKSMLKLSDSSDAGTLVWDEGIGAVISRLGSSPASTITIPGTVVATP